MSLVKRRLEKKLTEKGARPGNLFGKEEVQSRNASSRRRRGFLSPPNSSARPKHLSGIKRRREAWREAGEDFLSGRPVNILSKREASWGSLGDV